MRHIRWFHPTQIVSSFTLNFLTGHKRNPSFVFDDLNERLGHFVPFPKAALYHEIHKDFYG
jgi:hypothetical protein